MSDVIKEKPPGLWSSEPTALLATLAAGTGAIALGSIGVEIWTDQALAQTSNVGVAFVSAPIGLATLVLAALTARSNTLWSAPGFVFALAYWITFALAA